ncbi:MAG: HEAT repeat domain-containing protein [Ktedonobacteraceae bacterium]|nr:HEAT repeat domain-containing protein [Ktedonobacteraceae bacterium]
MPQIQFCPTCRAINLRETTLCEQCKMSLIADKPLLYEQKLLWALSHPLPDMRELAARLLGERRHHQILPLLMERLLEETDSGVLCAISETLGRLGDCQAATALAERLAQPNTLVVALTIVDALATLARTGCWEALDVLKAPPTVAERVRREITARWETLNRLYW